MTTRAAVALGSNLGDRRKTLASAVAALSAVGEIIAVSPLYETAPMGGPDQPAYLNAVVVLDTDHAPRELLDACLDIEARHGRERREQWGPRTLDLDLILYGAVSIDEPGLTVPHPRMAERRFVLAPLADAWPTAVLPGGRRITLLLDGVSDQEASIVDGPHWWAAGLLANPSPEVGPQEAAAAAREMFGIEGVATHLDGERDANFRVDGPAGAFVLKIANTVTDPARLEMQQRALEHIEAADPGLAVPRPVRTSAGSLVGMAAVGERFAPVTAQTLLGGDRLPDGHSTADSRSALAGLLVRLGRALDGFDHPLLVRNDLWDPMHLPDLAPYVQFVRPDRRQVVLDQIRRFRAAIPRLASLPQRVIHSDANPANLLTEHGDPDSISGIVDFGDLGAAPRVAEVAIAAAYQCMYQDDPAAAAADLIDAFSRLEPLDADERECCETLVIGRLVQSHTISAFRAELHPANSEYILVHAEPVWLALEGLVASGWRIP